jgi:phosphate transport system substrate-binding protein
LATRRLALAGLILALVPLAPATVAAEPIKVGGTGGATRTITLLAEAYRQQTPGAQIVVLPRIGSRGAKKGLITGAVDVGFVSQPPSPAEAERGLAAFEYARTALVFATANGATPSMTSQAIIEAYAGKVTRWPDGRRLRLILRPAGGSDNAVLRNISPIFRQAVDTALKRDGMLIAATDQEAADAIASVPGALGTTTLALIVAEQRPLTALALDGVIPSMETIARGTYPHTKAIHVVVRHQEARPAVAGFLRFLQTPDARAIVAGTGFLPLPAPQ